MCATRSSCVAHGGVDARVPVAVHVAPQRRDAVDVAAPSVSNSHTPSAALDRRAPPPAQACIWVNGCQTWMRGGGARHRAMVASPQVGNRSCDERRACSLARPSTARPARVRGRGRVARRRDRGRAPDGAVLRRLDDRLGEHDRRRAGLAVGRLLARRPLRRPPPAPRGPLRPRARRGARGRRWSRSPPTRSSTSPSTRWTRSRRAPSSARWSPSRCSSRRR